MPAKQSSSKTVGKEKLPRVAKEQDLITPSNMAYLAKIAGIKKMKEPTRNHANKVFCTLVSRLLSKAMTFALDESESAVSEINTECMIKAFKAELGYTLVNLPDDDEVDEEFNQEDEVVQSDDEDFENYVDDEEIEELD